VDGQPHHLPWAQFLVAQATAYASWWQTNKDNYKQWVIAENTSETTWQGSINQAHSALAALERNTTHDEAIAAALDTQAAGDGLAEAAYEEQAGLLDEAQAYLTTLAQAQHDKAIELAQAALDGMEEDDWDLEEEETEEANDTYNQAVTGATQDYTSAANTAAAARIAYEADNAKAFVDDLSLCAKNAVETSAGAEDAYDGSAARADATLAGADALLDKNYWTARATSILAMAQSLAVDFASPFTAYFAAAASAYSTFVATADAAKADETIATANADAGIDASGNPTGGGELAIDDEQRDEEFGCAEEAFDEAEQEAATAYQAALANAAAGGSQPISFPPLEPATLQAIATQAFWKATNDMEAPRGPRAGFLDLPKATTFDAPPSFPDPSKNSILLSGDEFKTSSPVAVEDARNSLETLLAKQPAQNSIVIFQGLGGLPVVGIGTPTTGLPNGFKVDAMWTAQEIDRQTAALALGGAHGPMTTAQVEQAARYRDAIQRQIEYENKHYIDSVTAAARQSPTRSYASNDLLNATNGAGIQENDGSAKGHYSQSRLWNPLGYLLAGYHDTVNRNLAEIRIEQTRLGRAVARINEKGEVQFGFVVEQERKVPAPGEAPWYYTDKLGYTAWKWVETEYIYWGPRYDPASGDDLRTFVDKQKSFALRSIIEQIKEGAADDALYSTESAYDFVIDTASLSLARVGGVGKLSREAFLDGTLTFDGVANAGFQTLLAQSISGKPVPLKDQVLERLQGYADEGYARALELRAQGKLVVPGGVSEETFIGQLVDRSARKRLRSWLAGEGLAEGQGAAVEVNRRLYDPLDTGEYAVPDVRIAGERLILDVTIGDKTLTTPQIRSFIQFSNGDKIILVRPFTPHQVLNP
jgi:hypothetical protein